LELLFYDNLIKMHLLNSSEVEPEIHQYTIVFYEIIYKFKYFEK